jgi:hypothetical protein
MMRTMPPELDEPGRRAAVTPPRADAVTPPRASVVTPLRRPPVRQSVVVRAPQRRTFDTFVRTIGAWWPVEHRGWEALTDAQLGADCALPGGYAGGSYAAGWALILGRLGNVLGLADTDGGQA